MKQIRKKLSKIAVSILFIGLSAILQATERPAVWGIARMTYLVSNIQLADRYYGEFLGFDKAFTYQSEQGRKAVYKVNDRQFIECVEDRNAKEKDRFLGVAFDTENAEQMRVYLKSKGVRVPDAIQDDGAGNKILQVLDPVGVPIEFIQWDNKSLHKASKGQFLSETRISDRIHHAGLFTDKLVDNPTFYTEILGFKCILRVPEDLNKDPEILYFQIPGCAEFIEHYPTNTRAFSHPCFVARDMQEVIYTLKERKKDEKLNNPMIGKGRRWLLNLHNSDGTRVEFTEMFIAR